MPYYPPAPAGLTVTDGVLAVTNTTQLIVPPLTLANPGAGGASILDGMPVADPNVAGRVWDDAGQLYASRTTIGAKIAAVSFTAVGQAFVVNAGTGLAPAASLGQDAYDNVCWDSDDFAGIGVVAPIDTAAPPDNYLAGTGILTVPAGRSGIYLVEFICEIGTMAMGATSGVFANPQIRINGGAVSEVDETAGQWLPPMPGGGVAAPVTAYPEPSCRMIVYLAAGDTVQGRITSLFHNQAPGASGNAEVWASLAVAWLGAGPVP